MASLITSTVRTERLARIVREFPRETAGELDTWLNKNARTLISSSGKIPGLVQVTPPNSEGIRGTAAKKQGENAVSRDIWKVYATPGKIYALINKLADEKTAKRWYLLHKKDPKQALAWLRTSAPSVIRQMAIGWDGGAAHDKSRRKTGRVYLTTPRVIVLNGSAQIRRYIKERQKRVGLLASSIPTAAGSRFGTLNGVPAWVKRHSSRYGYVRDKRSGKKRTITLGITSSAIEDMQRRFRYVLNYRLAAMERELPYVAAALEKKLRARLK
jgi:hypothetical protein